MYSTHWWISIQKVTLAILILPGLLSPHKEKSPSQQETEHAATILVVDDSGSMEVSDPHNLRCVAVQMFVSLLDENDEVAVVRFSTESHSLTDGLVSLDGHRGDLLDKVRSCTTGGYTDIKAALGDVRQLLPLKNVQDKETSVILLTDGNPEIQNPYEGYEQEILDLSDSLHVPIYSIALTSSADRNFLSRLSDGTGGYVLSANEATDLLDAYLKILGDIKDRTILGNGLLTSPGDAQFLIDPALAPYVEKASFVISNPKQVAVQLIAPDGHVVRSGESGVQFSYRADEQFTVTTISHPSAGRWRFELTGNGQVMARAILYSRLRAQIASPIDFQESGEPIPIIVTLIEEQEDNRYIQIIGEADFSAEITLPDGTLVSLDRFYDDGTNGDQKAGDGNFTRLYSGLSPAGTYHIVVRGRKGPIPVEQETDFQVMPFPKLVIDAPTGKYDIRDQPLRVQAHFTGSDPSTLDQGDVIAHLTSPSGETHDLLLRNEHGSYSAEFIPLENGKYRFDIETRSAKYLGEEYRDAEHGEFTVHLVHQLLIGETETEVVFGCFQQTPKVKLLIPVSSLRKERINLTPEQFPEFTLFPVQVEIQPGEQQLDFSLIRAKTHTPFSGEYHGQIVLSGSDDIVFQPASVIPVTFYIPSLWSRCRKPISWGSLLLIGFVLGGITTVKHIRTIRALPCVTGTLRWWNVMGDPAAFMEIDLTSLHRTLLTLGGHPGCDLVIQEGNLEHHHVTMLAEKMADGIQIFLQPIAAVKKGYGFIHSRIPLQHADQFTMGGLNFQYLSDSGE